MMAFPLTILLLTYFWFVGGALGQSLQDVLKEGGSEERYKYPTAFTQGIVPVSLGCYFSFCMIWMYICC